MLVLMVASGCFVIGIISTDWRLWFLTSAEEHLSGRTKENYCSVVVYDRSDFVAEGNNAYYVVAKGWHDVSLAKA